VQRRQADEIFQDVSGQLSVERDRMSALEVGRRCVCGVGGGEAVQRGAVAHLLLSLTCAASPCSSRPAPRLPQKELGATQDRLSRSAQEVERLKGELRTANAAGGWGGCGGG
jgi:hypothetical protein